MTDEFKDLKARLKSFSHRIIKLYAALPKSVEAQVIGKQLLRSGTSVGAHYYEAQRARSIPEFVSKVEGGLQELEETVYWLELLADAEIVSSDRLKSLHEEAEELTAILVTAVNSSKAKLRRTGLTFILHPSASILPTKGFSLPRSLIFLIAGAAHA